MALKCRVPRKFEKKEARARVADGTGVSASEHRANVSWQLRIEDERITTEQKFERKLEIITRELSRREYVLNQVRRRPALQGH